MRKPWPIPYDDEIRADSQFEVQTIAKEYFEQEWKKALPHGAGN